MHDGQGRTLCPYSNAVRRGPELGARNLRTLQPDNLPDGSSQMRSLFFWHMCNPTSSEQRKERGEYSALNQERTAAPNFFDASRRRNADSDVAEHLAFQHTPIDDRFKCRERFRPRLAFQLRFGSTKLGDDLFALLAMIKVPS